MYNSELNNGFFWYLVHRFVNNIVMVKYSSQDLITSTLFIPRPEYWVWLNR